LDVLLNKKTSKEYVVKLKKEYDEFRTKFLKRGKEKSYISIKEARKRKYKIDWDASEIVKPKELGIQTLEQLSLKELVPFIDWSPFFRSWDLHGKFPAILTDEVVGEQASILYKEAQEMIDEIIVKKQLKPKAIFGLFEANTINEDDIEVLLKPNRSKNVISSEVEKSQNNKIIFRTLRQQLKKREGIPNLALSDFIAPKSSNKTDYMGAFCVAIFGAQELADGYRAKEDDYNGIMAQAIADRFAEAFAEYLHKQIRTKHWGYASSEALSNDELIKESYKGIRPAPGYPACPDHLEKETIWKLLAVEEQLGVQLTESLAMWPAAAVSGYYFANKEAKYFGLGKITDDQVTDYSIRKGITKETARKWLHPTLAEE
jgi:5-methyltetrahydrofolate--homocysteine methyltransferase